jgi:hypothetical protein
MKKEVFVCDTCGMRKRLNSAERHWCEACTLSSPVEMRPARDKRHLHKMAPLVLPVFSSDTRLSARRVLLGLESAEPEVTASRSDEPY